MLLHAKYIFCTPNVSSANKPAGAPTRPDPPRPAAQPCAAPTRPARGMSRFWIRQMNVVYGLVCVLTRLVCIIVNL